MHGAWSEQEKVQPGMNGDAEVLKRKGLHSCTCLRGKGPQSRRLTASLFKNAHEIIKEKRKFVVIL
eukprot:903794-Pelagomonas_calceolata.AAC.1